MYSLLHALQYLQPGHQPCRKRHTPTLASLPPHASLLLFFLSPPSISSLFPFSLIFFLLGTSLTVRWTRAKNVLHRFSWKINYKSMKTRSSVQVHIHKQSSVTRGVRPQLDRFRERTDLARSPFLCVCVFVCVRMTVTLLSSLLILI